MTRLLFVLMTVALLGGCVFEQGLDLGNLGPGPDVGDRPTPEPAGAWTGKSESELVAQQGAPNRTYTMADGRRALTYDTWNGSSAGFCTRTFIVKDGVVQSLSTKGKRCS